MKITSLFNKRNYNLIYNIIKPYPINVNNTSKSYSNFNSINDIINYLNISSFNKIAVVATGPSANYLKLEDDVLYFTTNGGIQLVKNKKFIYVVNDSYFIVKYIKSFKENKNWRGTFFIFKSSKKKNNEFGIKLLYRYLSKKSRGRYEFLITDDKSANFALSSIHYQISKYLRDELGINYFGVNSGFVTLVFAYIIADLCNKKIDIYGLDLGERIEGYFDKKVALGKSIKGDFTKNKIGEFLDAIYSRNGDMVTNKSYFKSKE